MSSTLILLTAGLLAADLPSPPPAPTGPALSLAQAEQNALRHQPTVRQAIGQTEAATGRVEEARAGYLPQINAVGTYYIAKSGGVGVTTTGMPVATGMAGQSSGTQYGLWSAGANASQLIYDFNATADKWRSASASRDAAAANERTATLQALLNVRRAYFTARGARDLATVAEEAVANQKKHLDQIVAMVAAGMKSQIDLATQRTALANAEVQSVTAANTYATDLALLDQAMGLPSEAGFELTDTEMAPVPGEDGDERQLIDSALKVRPEVVNAQQQQRAQELTVASERGNYFPAFSGVGGVTQFGGGTGGPTTSWFVGLQATWAILQGGLTTGQIHEAKGTLASLEAQVDATRLQVSVDVVQGRLAVRAAKASIGGAEEALANAREQLRLAEARYQTGQGSIIELADAQVAYTTSEAQEVSARYSLASARAQLLTALGTR
jgi:outer membrane protein